MKKPVSILEKLKDVKCGTHFTATINHYRVKGVIRIERGKYYFCTDHCDLDGCDCEFKYGYKNSWILDDNVRNLKILKKRESKSSYASFRLSTHNPVIISPRNVQIGCQTIPFKKVETIYKTLNLLRTLPKVEIGDYGSVFFTKDSINVESHVFSYEDVEKVYKKMIAIKKRAK